MKEIKINPKIVISLFLIFIINPLSILLPYITDVVRIIVGRELPALGQMEETT